MRADRRGRLAALLLLLAGLALAGGDWQIARLKYGGGGDWYNDPDAIPNLAREVNRRTGIRLAEQEVQVSLLDERLYGHPFLFMTGHGNVAFSDEEAARLRGFLEAGGFLYADDDYGMDASFRREMARVLPGSELVELPADHPLFSAFYRFPEGLPKTHEHEEGPPRAFGMFLGGRLAVLYTFNANISDGWSDAHDNPAEVREQAYRMGVNILVYFSTN
ncbi:MAG: DUF4159 domain-containing protein [bacterium]